MEPRNEVFSPCGEIVKLRMMKDQTGISMGFCFVRFSTKEVALKAQKDKDGIMLHGKRISVVSSDDQDSLFFGNTRKGDIRTSFRRVMFKAFKDVVSIDLAMSSSTGGSPLGRKRLNRGFAFVQFSSHAIKVAFVGNLPTNADEDFLKQLFEPLGKVERVALSSKGYSPVGFVHFANRFEESYISPIIKHGGSLGGEARELPLTSLQLTTPSLIGGA